MAGLGFYYQSVRAELSFADERRLNHNGNHGRPDMWTGDQATGYLHDIKHRTH